MNLIIAVLFFGTPALAQSGIRATPSVAQNATRERRPPAKVLDLYEDIRQYGARAANFETIANCRAGSAKVVLASASNFANGDGVVLYGCGPVPNMARPSAVTVTSGSAETETVPDALLAKLGSDGSSSYGYSVIAIDGHGGATAASALTTITDGPARLGIQSAPVTSAKLSGNTLTVATTAAVSVNTLVHFSNSSNAYLSGWYIVSGVRTGTFVATGLGQYANPSSPITSTGGVVTYAVANRITWPAVTGAQQYVVCARRPGDPGVHPVGMSFPTGFFHDGPVWDDFGANFQLRSFPGAIANLGNAICTEAQPTNDYLSTIIESGAGTTTLTLNAVASSGASGQRIRFDNGPAITAAMTAAGGTPIYIPSGTWVVNSAINVTGKTITQQGNLVLNETATMGDLKWRDFNSRPNGIIQFDWSGKPGISGSAYPLVLMNNQIVHDSIAFNISPNGLGEAVGSTIAPIWASSWRYVTFNSGTSSDYSGIGLAVHPETGLMDWDHCEWISGPSQTADASWSPGLYFMMASNGDVSGHVGAVKIVNSQFSRRGTLWLAYGGSAEPFTLQSIYRQGGITPLFAFQNFTAMGGVSIYADYLHGDTETQPMVAVFSLGNTGWTTLSGTVTRATVGGSEPGGTPPTLSGQLATSALVVDNPVLGIARFGDSNLDSTTLYNVGFQAVNYLGPTIMNAGIFWPLPTPVLFAPTLSSGGSVSTGRHTFCVANVDWRGGEGSCGNTQAINVSRGKQTVNLSWEAVSGAQGYIIEMDGNHMIGGGASTGPLIKTTSYTLSLTPGCCNPLATVNGAGYYVDTSGATLPMLRLTNGQLKVELTLSPSGSAAIGADGSSSHPLRPVEVGTCTMSSGTCTVTWANSFTSIPLCFATWNGIGTLTGIVKAIPSAKTCVVTSSVRSDNAVMQIEGVANPN